MNNGDSLWPLPFSIRHDSGLEMTCIEANTQPRDLLPK